MDNRSQGANKGTLEQHITEMMEQLKGKHRDFHDYQEARSVRPPHLI